MYEELKKAAEACKDLLPLRYMESHGSLYIRNDCGIVFDVHQNRSFPDFMAHNKAYADLALAANPSAVLALIAENERLECMLENYKIDAKVYKDSADQLKAENESLRKDAERYQVLRQADIDTIHNGGLFAGLTPDNVVINGCDLDDRTDAVIRSRKDVDL